MNPLSQTEKYAPYLFLSQEENEGPGKYVLYMIVPVSEGQRLTFVPNEGGSADDMVRINFRVEGKSDGSERIICERRIDISFNPINGDSVDPPVDGNRINTTDTRDNIGPHTIGEISMLENGRVIKEEIHARKMKNSIEVKIDAEEGGESISKTFVLHLDSSGSIKTQGRSQLAHNCPYIYISTLSDQSKTYQIRSIIPLSGYQIARQGGQKDVVNSETHRHIRVITLEKSMYHQALFVPGDLTYYHKDETPLENAFGICIKLEDPIQDQDPEVFSYVSSKTKNSDTRLAEPLPPFSADEMEFITKNSDTRLTRNTASLTPD